MKISPEIKDKLFWIFIGVLSFVGLSKVGFIDKIMLEGWIIILIIIFLIMWKNGKRK